MSPNTQLLQHCLRTAGNDGFRASIWIRTPDRLNHCEIPFQIFEQAGRLIASHIGTILPVYDEVPPATRQPLVLDDGTFRYTKRRLRQYGIRHVHGIVSARKPEYYRSTIAH